MIFKIHFNTLLSDTELHRIKSILEESDCPNESFRATFPKDYDHMENENIYFNHAFWDQSVEISCEPKVKPICR